MENKDIFRRLIIDGEGEEVEEENNNDTILKLNQYNSTYVREEPKKGVIKKCLVVGSAGFLGKYIVDVLVRNDWSVIGIDKKCSPTIFNTLPSCEYMHIVCDIRNFYLDNRNVICKAQYVDACVYCIDKRNIEECMSYSDVYIENRLVKIQGCLELLCVCDIKKLVYISSTEIYKSSTRFLTENSEVDLSTPYLQGVYASEKIIKDWAIEEESYATILRISNIGQRDVIPQIIWRIYKGESIPVYYGYKDTEDRSTYRDYIHIDDVLSAIVNVTQYLFSLDDSEEYDSPRPGSTLSTESTPRNSNGKLMPVTTYNLGCETIGYLSLVKFIVRKIIQRKKTNVLAVNIIKKSPNTEEGKNGLNRSSPIDYTKSSILIDYSKIYSERNWCPQYFIEDIVNDVIKVGGL